MGKMIIVKRNGEHDCIIEDGEYHLEADVIIENGRLKYIDNGIWTKGYEGENLSQETEK